MCWPEEAEMIQYEPGWAARAAAEKPKKNARLITWNSKMKV